MLARLATLIAIALVLTGCGDMLWNDPYPAAERGSNTLYTAFVERPKHLDPALSYASDEWDFIAQIYEPPLQYHYLKRPYELVPLAGDGMPRFKYFDKSGSKLPGNTPASKVAFTVWTIKFCLNYSNMI